MKASLSGCDFTPFNINITIVNKEELRELCYRIKCDLDVVNKNAIKGTILPKVTIDSTRDLYWLLKDKLDKC